MAQSSLYISRFAWLRVCVRALILYAWCRMPPGKFGPPGRFVHLWGLGWTCLSARFGSSDSLGMVRNCILLTFARQAIHFCAAALLLSCVCSTCVRRERLFCEFLWFEQMRNRQLCVCEQIWILSQIGWAIAGAATLSCVHLGTIIWCMLPNADSTFFLCEQSFCVCSKMLLQQFCMRPNADSAFFICSQMPIQHLCMPPNAVSALYVLATILCACSQMLIQRFLYAAYCWSSIFVCAQMLFQHFLYVPKCWFSSSCMPPNADSVFLYAPKCWFSIFVCSQMRILHFLYAPNCWFNIFVCSKSWILHFLYAPKRVCCMLPCADYAFSVWPKCGFCISCVFPNADSAFSACSQMRILLPFVFLKCGFCFLLYS